jgi:hypothetical protein
MFIDLTESEKIYRKKESKMKSNKKQGEKRREEKERERERLKSLSPGEKKKLARGVMERDKDWIELELYSNKENDFNWSTGKRKRDWLERGEEGEAEDDFWEINKLPEIIERMDRDKKAERERAEFNRIERSQSRWALKAQDLERKDKEAEKGKEKENEREKETSAERRFRFSSEPSLGHKQWRDQINQLMTGRKPETKVRYYATDSPLSCNMEERELDYLPQPDDEADEESEQDNNNN